MQLGPKSFVDESSVKFQQKLGRVVHDLHLLQSILAIKNNISSSADFVEGYNRQSTTLMNSTIRGIFKKDNGGLAFNVFNYPFRIIINDIGSFEIPGGIVTEIHMGCFPTNTHLIIDGYGQWLSVGAKQIK